MEDAAGFLTTWGSPIGIFIITGTLMAALNKTINAKAGDKGFKGVWYVWKRFFLLPIGAGCGAAAAALDLSSPIGDGIGYGILDARREERRQEVTDEQPSTWARVWAWLKKWGALIGGVLLAILTLGALGGLAHKFWRDRLIEEDKAKVEEAERKMEELRGRRKEVERQIGDQSKAVRRIDVRIDEQREVIREVMRTGAGMSDEEIAAEFARLGY